MKCIECVAGIIIPNGIGYRFTKHLAPEELVEGDLKRTDQAIQYPPEGSQVFYGAIFRFCPICGESLGWKE